MERVSVAGWVHAALGMGGASPSANELNRYAKKCVVQINSRIFLKDCL